jgi:hypothetical protein
MLRIADIATLRTVLESLRSLIDGKQSNLVSGSTIKTINGNDVLGSGDLEVGGSSEWGGISGTLSSQTDLQNALDAKQDSADSIQIKSATVTVPRTNGGRYEHSETMADADVTGSSVLSAYLAPHLNSDENSADMLSLQALTATAGDGTVTFNLAFNRKEAGPIKLNYLRG